MLVRRIAVIALGATLALGVAACTTEPTEPTPTPAFASEEEAFAAAEETYRAYVDALNGVDLSDPDTFEPVFALLSGDASASTRQSFSQMHADGLTVVGRTVVALVEPIDTNADASQLALAVCLDVSGVEVVDSAGASVVEQDRGDVHSMRIELVASDATGTGLTVDEISARSGEPACEP